MMVGRRSQVGFTDRTSQRLVFATANADPHYLWLFKAAAPKNGQEVEVIMHQFKFTAE